MMAALEGRVEVVETLFSQGAVLDTFSGNGQSALMIATVEGHLEVVRALLEHGAQVNAVNKRGWTALRFAVFMDETEILRQLIKAGAEVNIADHEGQTALMQAASENLEESLTALLDAGADPCLKDHKEQTALMLAEKQGHAQIVKRLRYAEANASTEPTSPVSLPDDDYSYFHFLKEELEAMLNSHPDSPLTEEVVRRLLDAINRQRSLSPSEISHKLTLTLQEAAALSGLPRQHLLEAIKDGGLKAQLLEHVWRIKRADLDDYIHRLS
jgi:excisionase family DNA binding protein